MNTTTEMKFKMRLLSYQSVLYIHALMHILKNNKVEGFWEERKECDLVY